MDGTPESLETISRALAKHGVTGFVGTTVTADWDVSIQAYKNMASAYQKGLAGAQLLGAYNEGLFFAGHPRQFARFGLSRRYENQWKIMIKSYQIPRALTV